MTTNSYTERWDSSHLPSGDWSKFLDHYTTAEFETPHYKHKDMPNRVFCFNWKNKEVDLKVFPDNTLVMTNPKTFFDDLNSLPRAFAITGKRSVLPFQIYFPLTFFFGCLVYIPGQYTPTASFVHMASTLLVNTTQYDEHLKRIWNSVKHNIHNVPPKYLGVGNMRDWQRLYSHKKRNFWFTSPHFKYPLLPSTRDMEHLNETIGTGRNTVLL